MNIQNAVFGSCALAAFAVICACSDNSGTSVEQPEYSSSVSVVESSSSRLENFSSSSHLAESFSSAAENSIESSSSELAEILSSSYSVESYSSATELSSSSSFDSQQSSTSLSPQSSASQFLPSSSSISSSSQQSSSSAEPPLDFNFYTGADISTVQEYERFGAKFYDVDGSEKDIFTLLKGHGFNAIRLRTFVSPAAQYGYAAAGCGHDEEAYSDKEHVIAYAQKVKAAGMAFLLDIHYSDNWADPGKQIIPSRWRNVKTSDELADSIYAYTSDLIASLQQVNATPDMVQIGNETTPGILIHVPNSSTNCWGDNVDMASTSINGDMSTASGKANAAKYFKAGIRAVKEVSPSTKTVLHIESIHNSTTINWWMNEIFTNQNVPADVMGFSAYTAYGDGKPDQWITLFESLASAYPNLEFIVAEYNGGDAEEHYSFDGSRKRTNEVVRELDHWIGTFFWEPTLSGEWGAALFDWDGGNLHANKEAFEEFTPSSAKH